MVSKDEIQTTRELLERSRNHAKAHLDTLRKLRKLYATDAFFLARNSESRDITQRGNQIGNVKDDIKNTQDLISFIDKKLKELG